MHKLYRGIRPILHQNRSSVNCLDFYGENGVFDESCLDSFNYIDCAGPLHPFNICSAGFGGSRSLCPHALRSRHVCSSVFTAPSTSTRLFPPNLLPPACPHPATCLNSRCLHLKLKRRKLNGAVIRLGRGGEAVDISINDYPTGVVAAEMPASFNVKRRPAVTRYLALHKISKSPTFIRDKHLR